MNLTPEQFARLEALFGEALDLPPPERPALLARVRKNDGAEMAEYLEQLLVKQMDETEPFEPVVPPPDPRPAKPSAFKESELILNRFRIKRLLGKGGMGEVYEAEDSDTGRIAIKTIRDDFRGDRALVRRFKQEVQLARMVTSPYVCRIHDVFTMEGAGNRAGIVFLTMEFLEGVTLADRIETEGAVPWKEAETIALQLCEGLEAVHKAGVIHRDFKSRNVMLTPRNGQPTAVVMDLGLAYRPDAPKPKDRNPLTRIGAMMGTPDYMSPEQFEGSGVSKAADIYALGVVLYEMVTGKLPFEAPTPMAAAVRRAKAPPPVSSMQPGLPHRWDLVIRKCLAYEPADRFHSAAEVADALRPPSMASTLRTFAQDRARRRWLGSAAALLALSVATVLGVRAVQKENAHQIPEQAQRFYGLATEAFANGNYLTAVNYLKNALKADPDYTVAHARLADAFIELDSTGEAQREVNQIKDELVHDLSRQDRLYVHAVRDIVRQDPNAALLDYKELLASAQDDVHRARLLVDVGRTDERAGKVNDALASYTKAIRLDKYSPSAFLRRAILESRQGKQEEADRDFREAEKIYGNEVNLEGTAEVDYQRGYVASKLSGHVKEAEDLLGNSLDAAKQIKSVPLQVRSMARLGAVEFGAGRDKQAAEIDQRAIQLAEENGVPYWATDAKIRLGIALVNSGEVDEGESKLRLGRSEAERNEWPRLLALSQLNLALSASSKSNTAESITLATAALSYYEPLGFAQEATQCLLILARAKASLGLYDEALVLGRRALEEAKSFGNPTQILQAEEAVGSDLLLKEEYLSALRPLNSAMSLAEGDAVNLPWEVLLLAENLAKLGRCSEASRILSRVSEATWMGDRNLKSRFFRLRALMFAEQGRSKESLAVIQQAMRDGAGVGGDQWDFDLLEVDGLVRTGESGRALAICEEMWKSRGKQSPPDFAAAQLAKAGALVELTQFQEARILAEEASKVFLQTGQKESELRSYWIEVRSYRGIGLREEERIVTEKILDIISAFKHNYDANYQQYASRPEIAEVLSDLAIHQLAQVIGPTNRNLDLKPKKHVLL